MRWTTIMLACAGFTAACGTSAEVGGRNEAEVGRATDPALTMPVARAAHSAVALADGRVLLIGGCVAESCEGGPASATADVFSAATMRFAPAGRLAERRVSTAPFESKVALAKLSRRPKSGPVIADR
ncbi:MAG: kelch motif-containing protein, partial [Novosphingobium sp.]|nr:kelch motif-containing protein [Novosphingobium sp.]